MRDRGRLAISLGAIGAAAGLAGALLGVGALLAVLGGLMCLGALARPREAAVIVGLASPLDNIVVVQTGSADIRFLEVLWLLIIASLAVRWALGRPLALARPPRWLERTLIAVGLWGFASAAASGLGFPGYRDAAQIAGYAAMLWLFAAAFPVLPRPTLERYLRGAAVIGAILLVLTLVDLGLDARTPYTVTAAIGAPVVFAPPTLKAQVANREVSLLRVGVFNQSIVTSAGLMASLVAVAAAFILTSKDRSAVRLAWLLGTPAAILLVLTFSRAAWAFAALAVLVVALRSGGRRIVLVGLGAVVAGAALLSVPQVSARLTNVSEESSTVGHLELWRTAFEIGVANPLFGTGPGSFAQTTGDQAHDFVLNAAAETGLPGAALVIGLAAGLLVWGWRRLASASMVELSVWLALAVSIAMNLTMNGYSEEMWWIWAGLMVALVARRSAAASTRPVEVRGDHGIVEPAA